MNFTVINHDWTSTVTGFERRAEADDKRKSALSSFDLSPDDVEVVKGDYEDYEAYQNRDSENEQANPPHDNHGEPVAQKTDGGTQEVNPEVVDHSPQGDPGTPAAEQSDPRNETPVEPQAQEAAEAIDKLGESLEDDPLNILPGHMQDDIQGTPAINKRGYAMIAERYGIEVTTTIESYPWENEENRCVAKAVAITEDGQRYTGHATACKDDSDMPEQIIELADTRAMKRSVSWASGIGIVAYEELSDEL